MLRLSRYLLVFCILLFLMLALRPTSGKHQPNDVSIAGVLATASAGGGEADVIFTLKNDQHSYLLNRGLEKGIPLSTLQQDAIGKPVTLYFPRHWTPLDPFGRRKHITRIDLKESVFFVHQ